MSKLKRRIAVFTGNRAEYSLLYPILTAIAEQPALDYHLIVSGAHLQEEFGRTIAEVERDGFHIHARVPLDASSEGLLGTVEAIASVIGGVAKVLADLGPDFLVVSSDRFESFAALIAGTQLAIPTAHIEGGDHTEGGALDDSVRHAMTKLAHLHFTTNEQASERVRRLGEEPWRIFTVGLPSLDLIARGLHARPEEVYARFHLDPDKPIILFTQHSVATEYEMATEQVRPVLGALEEAMRRWNCQVVATYPNNDAGGRAILRELQAFAARGNPLFQLHPSLGRWYYHGMLNVASVCVGNSSSGIKETKAFNCPCVNIGSRQKGRLRPANVMDVGYVSHEVLKTIDRCLHDHDFRELIRQSENPYGCGRAGERIAQVLASIEINRALIQKKMTY